MSDAVDLYTDGACSGNPGPGGWGVLMLYKGSEKELCGGEPATTNNRMELMAAIQGLESLNRGVRVRVHTDSTYVKDGITKWIHGWKKNGWKNAQKKPVKNAELWQRLETAIERHDVSWHWVKGHSDHPENDRADALARQGMAPYLSKLK
ncbi:MAG: ribonuclease HI [Parvibaculum sp.]|uniref:ribonuclease HI n=1 Tax=Parvibaculum sp. TaxID=2024848 RepID=UPI002AB80166|nr:ribonuclease HI [Parvibaculum sp.]MDZ4382226.1 ribonuclease HI [Parvibaculum sp.]